MDWISLLNIASFQPERLKFPDSWIGHIPFAAWLIRTLKPRIFVELGTHSGNSYFAFCQAVKEGHLPTRCFAVDTWKGDEHAGFYDEEIFEDVSSYNEQKYSHFSRLLRMTFDEAVAYFPDNAIDLLHIDGMHTYESVKHDFETWLPKLSNQAIVVFHDTNARERNFGVWKLWQELCDRFPLNFEFFHSYGLGVLLVSKEDSDYDDKPDSRLDWLSGDYPHRQFIREYFSALGLWVREKYLKQDLESKSHDAERVVESLRAELSASREGAAGLEAQL
ncbi:MAG: class I SAM-dependent methyltransferase, partial [Bacteroidales bacterium]